MISKEDFNKVWKDSSRDSILNQFYYEHCDLRKFFNQQEEFIKYLQDESKEVYRDGGLRQNIFRQILQKYKEIIGDKSN